MKKAKNIVHQALVSELKRKGSKAAIWDDIAVRLARNVEVNVGKLARVTKKNDVVAVPGKVLGTGELSHALIVGAENFSVSARAKIESAGGKAILLNELAEKHADGKGVKIIAG